MSAAAGADRPPRLRLGGMALRNGLLIHGPTHWAAAVRTPDGSIESGSGPKPQLAPGAAAGFPGLRGPLKLAESFMVLPLVRRALPAARLPFEDSRVAGAVAATTIANAFLRRRGRGVGKELAAAVLGLAPALVALRNQDLAAYHGVEHKAIGAYEQGLPDAADASKEHDRCGSNLVAPLLTFTVAGQALLEHVAEDPGPLARGAVAVAGVSAAVEVFAWGERNSGTGAARAFRRPGFELQRLVSTREPTADQLEVGRAALAEILRVEGAPGEAAPA